MREARRSVARLVAVAPFGLPAFVSGTGSSSQQLLAAAARGDVGAVREGVARGADLEVRDERGRTPLLVATHRNHVAAARVLIEAGADVNAKDAIQDSP